jgi:hypothetical protein
MYMSIHLQIYTYIRSYLTHNTTRSMKVPKYITPLIHIEHLYIYVYLYITSYTTHIIPCNLFIVHIQIYIYTYIHTYIGIYI